MAYSTIPKGNLYINAKLYTGNGTTNTAITGVGFQPDLSIIKARDMTYDHNVMDAVRGSTKRFATNLTDAESTQAEMIKSFASDGFNLGDNGGVNQNTKTYVAWNWKAGGGAGSSNTDGSINTTSTSVNTTSGCSISTYTGAGTNSTVGHGLGAVPKMFWIKRLNNNDGMVVYHKATGATKHMKMDRNNAAATGTNYFQDTAPTNQFVYIGSDTGVGDVGNTYVMYAFSEIQGFSKMSAYMGNGSTGSSGTGTSYIHCGFSPSYVLIKNGQQAAEWMIFDNKRQGFNPENEALAANLTAVERTTNYLNFFSNGFSLSNTDGEVNSAGVPYVFAAFAENPFVATSGSTAVPVTAK